jgi:hypothetical protein
MDGIDVDDGDTEEIGPVRSIFFGAARAATGTSTIVTLIVPVRPPYVAVTVTGWFDVTVEVVSKPSEVIVAYDEFSLQVGLIAVVVPLSHVPVAVNAPVAPSFIDNGPITVMLASPAGASRIVTLLVPVLPPYVAVTVAVWFAVTDGAVNSPAPLIVPKLALQVGVTIMFVPSLHIAVAVNVPVALSFSDDGPLTAMLLNVAAAFTIVTDRVAVLVTPPLV